MERKLVLAVGLCLVAKIAAGQSELAKEVFRLLPAVDLFDLSLATSDSMLQGKTYYPADNTEEQVAAYNYGLSTLVDDYLYVTMSFETGQRAVAMIEIRLFKRSPGDYLVLLSRTGGVPGIAYNQDELLTFIFNNSKKLLRDDKKVISGADESLLVKPNAPDSARKTILDNSNFHYDLSGEKLQAILDSKYISSTESLRKWLKGDRVYFDWVNDQFVAGKIEFGDPAR